MALADKSSKITLGIAAVSGVLALALTFAFLKSARQQVVASNAPEPGVEVLRAARDVPADKPLTPQDTETVAVPAETFASMARTAIKADELSAVLGRKVNHPVASGTILQYGDLVPVQDLKVHEGMVVMAIPVTEQGLLGGLLVPGDLVDVILALPEPPKPAAAAPAGATGGSPNPDRIIERVMESVRPAAGARSGREWKAQRILSSVRVLAVGGNLSRSRQQMILTEPVRPSGSTVLLELSPDDALRLYEKTVSGEGRLTLFLLPRPADAGASN